MQKTGFGIGLKGIRHVLELLRSSRLPRRTHGSIYSTNTTPSASERSLVTFHRRPGSESVKETGLCYILGSAGLYNPSVCRASLRRKRQEVTGDAGGETGAMLYTFVDQRASSQRLPHRPGLSKFPIGQHQ